MTHELTAQHHITAILVAHRDMIEAQQRGDSGAEVAAVQRMGDSRAALLAHLAQRGTSPVCPNAIMLRAGERAYYDTLSFYRNALTDGGVTQMLYNVWKAMLAASPQAQPMPDGGAGLAGVPDNDLPGMWERADFEGGQDEVRGPDWKRPNAGAPASAAADLGQRYRIEFDGFVGTVIGSYRRLDGEEGVVMQQDGSKVVHVYRRKWLAPADAAPVDDSRDAALWRKNVPKWDASLNRRATVEQWMFDAANGKRPMPTADDLRQWALKLGTPEDAELRAASGVPASDGGQKK